MLRSAIALCVLAFLGSAASGQLLRERVTGTPYGQFGLKVAAAGDIDGDGIGDYVVGEPVYRLSSASDEGRVTIYSGKDSSVLHTFVGGRGDMLGTSVAGAGDVDADGTPDIVVGAENHGSRNFIQTGLAVVYSGRTGGVLWKIKGHNDFEFVGTCVSGAGDFNGDGHPEVLVGTGFDYMLVVEHTGNILRKISGGLLFGYQVAGIGDVDLDSVQEFVVAESWYDPPSGPRRGRVHVLSGASGLPLYEVVGDADNDYLGRTLARLDDVNGDGISDFIAASYVSSQGGNQAGLVRVLSGKDGATLQNLLGSGDANWFGLAVTGCTDVNRDGIADFVVGTPGVPTTGSNGLGQVQLFSGADGSLLYDFFGQTVGGSSNMSLGFAVASSDFNRDGIPDFVFGDPLFDDPAQGPIGAVEIYLGCPAFSQGYGAGWPGTNGVPTLAASNDPGIGGTLSLNLSNSLGATTAGLLVTGLAPASIPLSSGATLLVSPALFVPLTIPAGGTVISGSIPNDPGLCFTQLFFQGIEFDVGAVGSLSLTAGLELSLGFDL